MKLLRIIKITVLTIIVIFFTCCTQKTTNQEFTRIMDTTFVSDMNYTIEEFRFFSEGMQRYIKVLVATPPAYNKTNKKFPVLYTLHGSGSPYDTWFHIFDEYEQLQEKQFIYTCFDGDRKSMYIDAYYPVKTARKSENDSSKRVSFFNQFFFNEFMYALDNWYRIDTTKRALTGFSMGGCGTFNYMLAKPEKFVSVSALSSVYLGDSLHPRIVNSLTNLVGSRDSFPERYNKINHYVKLKEYKDQNISLPPIYLHCGKEDFLLEENRGMNRFLLESGFDVTYLETEGKHNWDFWLNAGSGVINFHWKHFQ